MFPEVTPLVITLVALGGALFGITFDLISHKMGFYEGSRPGLLMFFLMFYAGLAYYSGQIAAGVVQGDAVFFLQRALLWNMFAIITSVGIELHHRLTLSYITKKSKQETLDRLAEHRRKYEERFNARNNSNT